MDIPYPQYQLNIPEVYQTWDFSEYYPDQKELRRYFQHIDKVLDISKDTYYKSTVTTAQWDDNARKWTVTLHNGQSFVVRYLIPCVGIASKSLFPDWPGLADFRGETVHSSRWPEQGGPELSGRRVGVIGTGATGVQIAQTVAPAAKHLTVFMRTPNIALPMNRRPLPKAVSDEGKAGLVARVFARERFSTPFGALYNLVPEPPVPAKDMNAVERTASLDRAYATGGFGPTLIFEDLLVDPEVNRFVYDDWARVRRARITDLAKRDLLVPLEPMHPFAGKRQSLEQDYYEQMDKPHVALVDVKATPVVKVVPEGVVTADGKVHELDVLVIATGFDMVTGSYDSIRFLGVDGELLERKWKGLSGVVAHLGIAAHRFPNMFMACGPLSPNVYAVATASLEQSCDWILKVIKKLEQEGKTRIEATATAEEKWAQTVSAVHAITLRDKVDSYYMGEALPRSSCLTPIHADHSFPGANVPGKKRQALMWAGGIPAYGEALAKTLENDLEGFEVSRLREEAMRSKDRDSKYRLINDIYYIKACNLKLAALFCS